MADQRSQKRKVEFAEKDEVRTFVPPEKRPHLTEDADTAEDDLTAGNKKPFLLFVLELLKTSFL